MLWKCSVRGICASNLFFLQTQYVHSIYTLDFWLIWLILQQIFLPESLALPIRPDGPARCIGLFAFTTNLRFSSIVYVFIQANKRQALQRGDVFRAQEPKFGQLNFLGFAKKRPKNLAQPIHLHNIIFLWKRKLTNLKLDNDRTKSDQESS